MFGIGPVELMLIGVVALLVFGPKRLPELARTLGRGMGEFRRASSDLRQSLALDDLQRELRGGPDPTTRQTIHKPGDRPAQAGDGLESGPATATSPGKHPGELPLGNDHEHHDLPDREDEEPATEQPAEATAAEADPQTPAETELGSVPVRESRPAPVDPKRG